MLGLLSNAEVIELVQTAHLMRRRLIHALSIKHPDERELMILEDAVEEAIVLFWQKIRKLEHPETPYSWLLQTSENRYQHLRDARDTFTPISELTAEPGGNDNAMAAIDAETIRAAILKRLPNKHWRATFDLHEQKYSVEEIAEATGTTVDAAYHFVERSQKRAQFIYTKVLKLLPPPVNNRAKRPKNHSKKS